MSLIDPLPELLDSPPMSWREQPLIQLPVAATAMAVVVMNANVRSVVCDRMSFLRCEIGGIRTTEEPWAEAGRSRASTW
jgi:hypothetical protein